VRSQKAYAKSLSERTCGSVTTKFRGNELLWKVILTRCFCQYHSSGGEFARITLKEHRGNFGARGSLFTRVHMSAGDNQFASTVQPVQKARDTTVRQLPIPDDDFWSALLLTGLFNLVQRFHSHGFGLDKVVSEITKPPRRRVPSFETCTVQEEKIRPTWWTGGRLCSIISHMSLPAGLRERPISPPIPCNCMILKH
jgi:hypothetical protein